MKNIFYFTIIILFTISCNRNKSNVIYSLEPKPRQVILSADSTYIKDKNALKLFENGLSKIKEKKYADAKALFQKADKIEPNNIVILDCLANIESPLGNNRKSIEMFYKILPIDSTYINCYINLGQSLMLERNYDEATNILVLGLKKSKNYSLDQKSTLYLNLAISYNNLKNCEEGLNYAEKALEISQNNDFKEFAEKVKKESENLIEKNNCH